MPLFGLLLAGLFAFPGAALAASGVAGAQARKAQAHLDFQITVTSVLTLDEASRGCLATVRGACQEVLLPSGKRPEHRSIECNRPPLGTRLVCTSSSP